MIIEIVLLIWDLVVNHTIKGNFCIEKKKKKKDIGFIYNNINWYVSKEK